MYSTPGESDYMRIRKSDLLENPTNRVPVALCLDVSASMAGEPINELNQGVHQCFDALRADPVANASAEVAIIAFADRAEVILDFQSLDRVLVRPQLQAGGLLGNSTNLGAGVSLALRMLEARKNEYKEAGVDYFQPILVLMTDGQPTTQEHLVAAPGVCALEEQRKLVVMPIGIGQQADMTVLAMFSRKNSPLRLKGLCFGEFFAWLSKSIVRMSQSRPGEQVPLEPTSGWASLG